MIPSRSFPLLAILLLASAVSAAAPVTYTYRIDPVESVYTISGGFAGTMREREVSGVFKVVVDGPDLWIRNVNVYPWTGFPQYRGTIDANGHFSSTQPVCPGFPANTYAGVMTEDTLHLESYATTCVYDGYSYSYDIEADLIGTEEGGIPPAGGLGSILRILIDLWDWLVAIVRSLLMV